MVPIRKIYWIRRFRFGSVTNLFCYRKIMGENIEVKTNVPLTSLKNIVKKKICKCLYGVTCPGVYKFYAIRRRNLPPRMSTELKRLKNGI